MGIGFRELGEVVVVLEGRLLVLVRDGGRVLGPFGRALGSLVAVDAGVVVVVSVGGRFQLGESGRVDRSVEGELLLGPVGSWRETSGVS